MHGDARQSLRDIKTTVTVIMLVIMSTSLPTPSPDTLTTTLDGQAVLLDLDSKRYFQINHTGTLIWEGLAAVRSRDAIIAELTERFRVDADEAARAFDAFVAELRTRGLVRDAV